MAETIGSLVDKITIVDLKIHHMREQMERRDTTPDHLMTCRAKFNALLDQRDLLAAELDTLIPKPPKPFPQFKMYNDPQYRSHT